MIFQSTWKCHRGSILGVLRSSSNKDKEASKTILIDLLEFRDSSLGNVIFQRLCPPISSSRTAIVQTPTIGTPPARLVLPPPPSIALPCTKEGGSVIQKQLTQRSVVEQVSANHNASQVHTSQVIGPAIWPNFKTNLWMSRLYDALSLHSRVLKTLMSRKLQWVTQALGAGQPLLQPGMTRVNWRCVCISEKVNAFVEDCSGLTFV